MSNSDNRTVENIGPTPSDVYELPQGRVTIDESPLRQEKFFALTELANFDGSDIQHMRLSKSLNAHFPGYCGPFSIHIASQLVRDLWKGSKAGSSAALKILSGKAADAHISKQIETAIAANAESKLSDEAIKALSVIAVDWNKCKAEFSWGYGLQEEVYDLLQHSELARKCQRRKCGRLFVAPRLPWRYCGAKCKYEAIQESLKKYYKTKGKKRRKQREAKQRKRSKAK